MLKNAFGVAIGCKADMVGTDGILIATGSRTFMQTRKVFSNFQGLWWRTSCIKCGSGSRRCPTDKEKDPDPDDPCFTRRNSRFHCGPEFYLPNFCPRRKSQCNGPNWDERAKRNQVSIKSCCVGRQ